MWTIGGILMVMWLFGLLNHVGGWLIHLLLVGAVAVFVWNYLTSRRTI